MSDMPRTAGMLVVDGKLRRCKYFNPFHAFFFSGTNTHHTKLFSDDKSLRSPVKSPHFALEAKKNPENYKL
jgi:hypothetical protein